MDDAAAPLAKAPGARHAVQPYILQAPQASWDLGAVEAPPRLRTAFDRRLARAYQQVIAARARIEHMPEVGAAASAQIAELTDDEHAPMTRLVRRLALDPEHVELVWTVVACSVDGRLVPHLEALGGAHARRGLSPAVYAMLAGLDDASVARLAQWLAASNPLVETGLLHVAEPASPAARAYAASPRLVGFLAGEDPTISPVRLLTAPEDVLHDRQQRAAIDELQRALGRSRDPVVVIEGASGSGRATAAACAWGTDALVLDLAHVPASQLDDALIVLQRECLLRPEIPLLANVDRALGENAREQRRSIGAFVDRTRGPVILTSTIAGADPGTIRALVRIPWPAADTQVRAALWTRAVEATGASVAGDLSELAHRYRVGPAAIQRAVASARLMQRPGAAIGEIALATGLRHNIAEQLGGLAQRVEVSQTWDDLVIADDTADQIVALVGRVRHAHQVLERWGYRRKIARGAGVAALFSGPPGTGKTMVAGLIARELDLELYQVDLSKVTSKWVGETEKNLSRIFDGAEEGHALLLFDEADSLFGQRSSETHGANDRYANLEVNYLLQRIEAFGGITILTTNLETAIDSALKRRLAAHIVFATPDEEERARLWERQTVTGTAPLDGDVDHHELARAFPSMSGANIRNAAISAAFLAAAAGAPRIGHEHLLRAARAEYRSMGHMVSEAITPGSLY